MKGEEQGQEQILMERLDILEKSNFCDFEKRLIQRVVRGNFWISPNVLN